MKLVTQLFCASCFLLLTSAKDKEPTLELKSVQKCMMKISDSLYACSHEVGNREYRIFENELKASGRTDDYKIALVDTEGWYRKYKFWYKDPMIGAYHWHPAYFEYPVVNLTYEGAELFCKWLTEKYNSWKGRKFKRVKFRLPTGAEWEFAARGGLKDKNYPWGNYLVNPKSKHWYPYRCNFRPLGDERIKAVNDSLFQYEVIKKENFYAPDYMDDGGTYTVKIWAYDPNGYGLYNMCGNVAEMISEKGIARGGSWGNTGYDVRIASKIEFEELSPEVGFRYFMEVIEK